MRIIPEPQYYPSPLEMVILIAMVVELLAIGYLVKRYWERRGENIPPTVALILWGVMVSTFAGLLFVFYLAMPEPVYIDDPFARAETPLPVDPRMRLTLWAFFMWLIPMGYYINLWRNSFASYAVDHIGPLSGAIEDPSEFADARRLALRGDVNGAVAKYRSYDHNKSEALFEAARLLKSEDRYDEAAAMFEEIMKNSPGNRRVWAEACYQLAKLHEVGRSNEEEAKRLLRLLLQRAPETRYGELASADLARLQTVEDILDDGEVHVASTAEDPFFDETDVRVKLAAPARRGRKVEHEEEVAPAEDPFFSGTHLRKAAENLKAKERDNGQGESAAVAKPRARKAPAAKAKVETEAVKPAAAKAAAKPKAVTKTSSQKSLATQVTGASNITLGKKPSAEKKVVPAASESAAPPKPAAAKKPAAKKKPAG